MLNGIYCVRDLAADSYMPPFMAVNDAVAIRSFAYAFKDDRSTMASAPGDYELVLIATYDQMTGIIEPVDKKIIARGTDYAV